MRAQREILITNDDSVNSKGIKELATIARAFGNVTIIAPKEPQSGMSTALTLEKPLRLQEIAKEDGVTIYYCTGTPTDCVKMAMNTIFKDKKPDLLLSGINHGSNASIASLYSGTLGAATEGTLYDIPSIGISIDNHHSDADFSAVKHFLPQIIVQYLEKPVSKGCYLNINFPSLPINEIKGIKLAKQGAGRWVKEFEERVDPRGRNYYWMAGHFEDLETTPLTDDNSLYGDHRVVDGGYISIVPHNIDNTDYAEIERLNSCWNF